MHACYLVNQYPMASHSFIRREIRALERAGVRVLRVAIRGWGKTPVDPQDVDEQALTRYALRAGAAGLASSLFTTMLARPLLFVAALRQAWRFSRPDRRGFPLHLVYLAEACRVAAWARAARCDHIHAHFGTNSAEVALLAATLASITCSFTVHGPEEFDRPQALDLGAKVQAADAVVAISSFCRSQLMRWVPAACWPRIHVVHCGLDESFLADVPSRVPSQHRFVCVGRLCEQKGQLLLLQALRQVIDSDRDCRLVLAGDGELRQDVEDRVAALGLQRHVSITGWIDGERVREEILGARALVLPSFAEGLPVVIMEAMALRRPVISTYVAGIPELVESGACGWLVPAGDVDALAARLVECLETEDGVLTRMGEEGRRRVLERHDIDTEARKLLAVFRGIN